jgi:hypothetical protein
LRAWAAQAAKTVNAGKFTDAALAKLMTPFMGGSMKAIMGDEVGSYYPGPAPMLPLSVSAVSPSERRMNTCSVATGFAQKPGAHVPLEALRLTAVDARANLIAGSWKVSQFSAGDFSCATVKVPMPTW